MTAATDVRRGRRHPRRRPAQDLRRPGRRRRRQLRGPAGRGVRPARPERRRQDDDRRGPRGPAPARLRRGLGPGRRRDPRGRTSSEARIGVSLQTAALYPKLNGGRGPRPVPRLLSERPARSSELIELMDLGEKRRTADAGPLGRPAPAAVGRPRARQRPGAGLPRRADDRHGPGRAAGAVGRRPGPQGSRAGRSC